MIVFDLLCAAGHRFEGWFASAEDFGSHKARGLLSCPSCGAERIERVPSATRFNTGSAQADAGGRTAPGENPAAAGKDSMALAQILYSRMLDELLKRTEDVGREFPAEARRIYYEESPARAIRGIASQQEHDELVEEGIPVARLPIPDKSGWS